MKGGLMKKVSLLVGIMIILSIPFVSSAYDVIDVKNGGNIEGVVEFGGASVPKDAMLTLSSEQKYCGKNLPAGTHLIRDKKIENVVVYLEDAKSGGAVPIETVTLTNLKCQF